ncbi:hypothetical protein MSG28_002111 [Choristoneura fumiferana]|uniref:Uncharacterized protein n=1 Tax=Choristoneura fumiferana TaxID=7141 RepID=A0ACC0JTV9_CHOFU|nr:hypothetical protein MSG28_002111 [Choristoneura fumiferana]
MCSTLGTGEHASEQSDSDNNTDPPPQPLNLSSTLGTGEHASEQSDSDNNTDPPPQFQNFSRNLSPSTPSSTPSLQIELDHDSNEEVVRSDATRYGNENEPIALKETEAALGVQVSPCGLYILEEHQYLGASPDGVIDEETIVEIKCPASAANMTPTEAILKKKITFCVLDESDPQKIKLKQNHNYFYQVQGLSTESAILCLKQTVKYYTDRDTPVYACFLDLSKAFDLVSYDLLWDKLRSAGLPEEYKLECGVRQGGLTSPGLFNLYINQLLEELSSMHVGCHIDGTCVNNISYADDMVLLGPSISSIRKLVEVCERYAEKTGLKYNSKKSEVLVFKATAKYMPSNVPSVVLSGVPLRVVQEFKYLGHIIADDLKDDHDIERERRALAVRSNVLTRRFSRCSNDVKITLFKAYCTSFYSSGLWFQHTKRAYNVLRVQYNNAFRMLLGLPRHCSASAMFAETRTDGFHAIMRKKTASLLQRVRGSNNSILSMIANRLDSPLWWHMTKKNILVSSVLQRATVSLHCTVHPALEHFGQKILLKCESLKFRLQAPIDGDKELLCQVEPYFTYLALYDARSGKKLTENFHFDLNHTAVKDLVKDTECTNSLVENFSYDVKLDVKMIPDEWFRSKRQAVLSINNPHPDLFLVVKIDKILQGHVSQVLEPYLKATKDPRLGLKVHKTVQSYAQRVGTYRMPFAWTAKPLFKLYSNDLDTTPEFPAIYRQEPNKMSDDDLLKILSDFRKPEKLSKLTVIPGWLNISIQPSNEQIPNCMTTAYAALKPFPLPPSTPLTVELATLNTEPEQPYAAFVNHLYIRPLTLNFESQKMFARARNIACAIELRENDTGENKPLQVVYGRVGMTSQYRCSVLHHNANPTWSDEVKIRLPTTITPLHHLLFTFYHISCDLTKKNDANVETCIGYAWVPLLKNNKFVDEIVNLSIATHLPSGYLSIQPLGLGKRNAGPEVIWVEGEKQLFRCQLVLDSTVATRDAHLHNLFVQAERLIRTNSPPTSPSPPPWNDVCNALKAAHAIKLSALVAFLPTILNQLFELMTVEKSYTPDMGYQIVKLIVHFIHMIHDYGRKDLLDSYVKYVFNCVEFKLHTVLTAPLHMFVDPNQQDFLLGHKFMQYSSFFFDIIIKSMAQYLINTGRIKMSRNERFHADLLDNIEKLVTTVEPSYILQQPMQTHIFNKNLAVFLKSCLSFVDRGFIFRQVKRYLDKFKMCEPKALFDFKFTFLQTICSHEHYVPFNLPLQANKLGKDLNEDPAKLKLSEDFIMRHFLSGTLLKQVEQSLREAPQKRRTALGVLRALLTKHEHDDRYRSRQCRARLAQLYAPWLTVVLENAHRLVTKTLASPVLENGHDKIDGDATANPILNNTVKDVASASSTPRRNRLTLHFEHTSARNSAHFKDPPVAQINNMYGKDHVNNASQSSLESVSTMSGGDSLPRNAGRLDLSDIGDQVNRFGVMSAEEVRDVLLCFLFVLKYLDEERLVEWWKTHSTAQQQSFFNVLEICAEQFQYIGRKRILSELKTTTPDCNGKPKPIKARTLPARMTPPDFSKDPPIIVEKNNTVNRENLVAATTVTSELETIAEHAVVSAGCLATEVGLTIIDRTCLFTKNLGAAEGAAARPYLRLLQFPQSETLYKHLFAALRAYINQFSETLFEGGSTLCAGVVSAVVKLCEARAAWLRREAAAALYLLMRANFQHGSGGNLTRVHLQVIIAVSKLLDTSTALNCKRFQESLSVINCFATGDKAMKGTGLSTEVAELMRRVRTVVGARARLAGVGGSGGAGAGSVHLAELQHALAASCRATPRLRHAWLATLAEHNARQGDHDEAMCCQLHIAALIAEYLKLRGNNAWGADAFAEISMNISRDETGLKIDEEAGLNSKYKPQP